MTLHDIYLQFLAAWGITLPAAPDPRVPEAIRQQQRVTGGSVRVDPTRDRNAEWNAAAACFERGLVGSAADWVIRATSQTGTIGIVEEG